MYNKIYKHSLLFMYLIFIGFRVWIRFGLNFGFWIRYRFNLTKIQIHIQIKNPGLTYLNFNNSDRISIESNQFVILTRNIRKEYTGTVVGFNIADITYGWIQAVNFENQLNHANCSIKTRNSLIPHKQAPPTCIAFFIS